MVSFRDLRKIMEAYSPPTLFIYFDESGNLDFTSRGTDHFVLTAFCTLDPLAGQNAMMQLAHELACNGLGQECFHATSDTQDTRDKVFASITALQQPAVFHATIARKRKVPPSLRTTQVVFYNYMVSRALRHIVGSAQFKSVGKLVVVFSTIFVKKDDGAMVGAAKSELKKAVNIPYWVYSHATKSESNCQIADYCCWATYIKHERNEERSYRLIQKLLASEQHLFLESGIDYY